MIEAIGLSKDYGATRALSEVSFSIGEHEIVGLLGPNGAGKTTLMKLLTGYLQPTAGTARVGGVDVVADPLAVQRQLGYLPENAPLYPDMLVQEYLQLMAALREIPEDRQLPLISEAVQRTALEEYLVQPIGTLSKGYRQRVGLAQAILHQPALLVLDEPTSGLDPNQIVEIRRLIGELAKSATVLLSTHILSEVELTCERVIIIREGRVQTDARLAELQEGGAALVAVESTADGVEQALQAIRGVTRVSAAGDHGTEGGHPFRNATGFTSYRVEGGGADLCPAIFDVARERGWRLAELRPDHRTLEAIFRAGPAESGARS